MDLITQALKQGRTQEFTGDGGGAKTAGQRSDIARGSGGMFPQQNFDFWSHFLHSGGICVVFQSLSFVAF